MSASMCQQKIAQRVLVGVAAALALAGCEHYAPNVRPDANSTEAIARAQAERLQARGATRVMAPSQVRIATGGLTSGEATGCTDWLDTCWEAGGAAATTEGLPSVTRPAPAQTFRGVLPCTEAAMNCTAQHTVLTLFANRTWRAHINYLGANNMPMGEARDIQGCWNRTASNSRQFVLLHQNGNILGAFHATSNNTLVSSQSSDSQLQYTLTRQPQPDAATAVAPNPAICKGLTG